ncbi:7737_t:CDS:2 [Paraglomus brasilianum]|uniref:7737_t:CDS:1 n=1 Tax=Paraglomus brasilianum TaxID=144538 RepID=A0A9N8ZDS1_9GLOM|nr:7737_t:CDS:2 [Paraglomus brasilianum]
MSEMMSIPQNQLFIFLPLRDETVSFTPWRRNSVEHMLLAACQTK